MTLQMTICTMLQVCKMVKDVAFISGNINNTMLIDHVDFVWVALSKRGWRPLG